MKYVMFILAIGMVLASLDANHRAGPVWRYWFFAVVFALIGVQL